MKRMLVLAIAVCVVMLPCAAAEIEGVLVDKACSAKAIKDGYAKAGAHTKDCALMDSCLESGFGVLTADNKYLLFDKEGTKKAAAALEASSKKDNLKVKVTGDMSGATIRVLTLRIL
ncbi:MAG: hypothetical protein HYZ37_00600 [Candidatus Solibacter usitatus]|nr:hypothetical protein [Candidatus Solibacter usitatus]